MLVMDDYEFLEELLRLEDLKHNDTSVILLSSSSYEKEKTNAEKLGLLGYIEKPVNPERLVELVTINTTHFNN